MKKVLIISPTPTHATNAGNRVHINLLSQFLISNNFEVHFLYLAYEEYDREQMESFWGSRLHILNRNRLYEKGPFFNYYFQRVIQKIIKVVRYLQKCVGRINADQYKYNSELNSHFPRTVKNDILQLQKKHQFHIVICEYAAMSKALTFFDSTVLKVLDTHDQFTDRFKLYLKNNLQPDWVSLYRGQEQKALRRADLIIALKETERIYFENLAQKKVICFFAVPDTEELPPKRFEKKLLYFASGNTINIKTLEFFEEEVLPMVLQIHPSVQLLVGGSICSQYQQKSNSTQLLGKFNRAEDFYKLGDIVINPELDGTGFKIKTLEALCYSMPVVCSTAGAAGLMGQLNDHLIIADGPKDFASALVEVLENDSLRLQTALKAKEWVSGNKEKMKTTLLAHLMN